MLLNIPTIFDNNSRLEMQTLIEKHTTESGYEIQTEDVQKTADYYKHGMSLWEFYSIYALHTVLTFCDKENRELGYK